MSLNAAIHLLRIDDTPKELGAELRSVILRLLIQAEVGHTTDQEDTIRMLINGYISLLDNAEISVRKISGTEAENRWFELYGRAYMGKEYDEEYAGSSFGPTFDWSQLKEVPASLVKDVAEASAAYDRLFAKKCQEMMKDIRA